jgi:mono/diheme cytochrome c family protein
MMNFAATLLLKRTLVAAISLHCKSSHRQRMTRRSERSKDSTAMRILKLNMSIVLFLFGGIQATFAQNAENGQRLSERWCSECHAIDSASDKLHRAPPFASIAAKPTIDADMIASFLLLPHATMPNLPLSRKDAQDIALFIVKMEK